MKPERAPFLAQPDAKVAQILQSEAERQAVTMDLVASENHASPAVLQAQGCLMADKLGAAGMA